MTTEKRPSEPTSWLDDEGRLSRGKYRGALATIVVDGNPDYVEWILSETDISDEDARILRVLLDRRAP